MSLWSTARPRNLAALPSPAMGWLLQLHPWGSKHEQSSCVCSHQERCAALGSVRRGTWLRDHVDGWFMVGCDDLGCLFSRNDSVILRKKGCLAGCKYCVQCKSSLAEPILLQTPTEHITWTGVFSFLGKASHLVINN